MRSRRSGPCFRASASARLRLGSGYGARSPAASALPSCWMPSNLGVAMAKRGMLACCDRWLTSTAMAEGTFRTSMLSVVWLVASRGMLGLPRQTFWTPLRAAWTRWRGGLAGAMGWRWAILKMPQSSCAFNEAVWPPIHIGKVVLCPGTGPSTSASRRAGSGASFLPLQIGSARAPLSSRTSNCWSFFERGAKAIHRTSYGARRSCCGVQRRTWLVWPDCVATSKKPCDRHRIGTPTDCLV
mmetsp:Transcript_119706/g.382075  ORF Transcript_119706/g.382075 Transcript_119706/m.382075 type:complete len:241 (-) Transcript_119706:1790-2512(-)